MKTKNLPLTRAQSKGFRALKPKSDINLAWGRGCGKSFFLRFITWYLVTVYGNKSRKQLLTELGWDISEFEELIPDNMRGIRIVWLMPTFKQFKAVNGPAFKEDAATYAALIARTDWTAYRVELKDGGWVQPIPAEIHSAERGRGLRCDVVIADEVDDIDPSVFSSIVKPWFSERFSLKIRVTAGTPKRGREGLLYQRHLLGLNKDPKFDRYTSIHSTYHDCPEVVDRDEVEAAKLDTPPSVFAREWECDFDSAEGLVYPFEEDFHVRAPTENDFVTEKLVGCDHGDTNPGVFLEIGLSGPDDDRTAWILNEVYETQKVESWWIEEGKKLSRTGYDIPFFCDPAMPGRIRAYQMAGIRAQKSDNKIADGISRVSQMLFRRCPTGTRGPKDYARLYVHPRCVNTIAEFKSYRRKKDPRNADRYLEDVEKKNDHAMDALRYALIERFGRLAGGGRIEVPGA